MHNRVGLGEQTKLMMSMSILLCSNLNYNCTIVLFEIFSMFFQFLLWVSRENGAETNNKDPMEPFNSKYFPSSPLGDPLHANCLKVFKHIQTYVLTYWKILLLANAWSCSVTTSLAGATVSNKAQHARYIWQRWAGLWRWRMNIYVSNKYQLFQR